MNVIISNRYSEMLSNLNIDVIKNVRGEYDAEVIVSNFQNFFYSNCWWPYDFQTDKSWSRRGEYFYA